MEKIHFTFFDNWRASKKHIHSEWALNNHWIMCLGRNRMGENCRRKGKDKRIKFRTFLCYYAAIIIISGRWHGADSTQRNLIFTRPERKFLYERLARDFCFCWWFFILTAYVILLFLFSVPYVLYHCFFSGLWCST